MLALTESKLFVGALKVAGPAFFLGMQASSVNTALTIIADKSVKSLSVLPFISLVTNCVIWTFYGILREDSTVLIPNAAGIISGAFCVSAYQSYTSKTSLEVFLASAAIIIVATGFALTGNYKMLGYIGCALAVFLMASPLATLKTVIQEKSTASIPFWTSFAGWCNAASWSAYGLLLAKDPMIYGPNLIGFTLASFQLLLFAIYGFSKTVPVPSKSIF